MVNRSDALRGICPTPFFQESSFEDSRGFIGGRICEHFTDEIACCLPCPLSDWAYSDNFNQATSVANWLSVVGLLCCLFLLLTWAVLPIEKTNRHYLSISLTVAITLMSISFIVPLGQHPEQCYDAITPNGMDSDSTCAVSGSLLLGGGWAAAMWVMLRSLSLHLQIVWQVVVGRNFMWIAHIVGWGVPVIGLCILLMLSGVSYRFGETCHINHTASLGDFWIPLLIVAGFAFLLQSITFGYCVRVYLASLADSNATTEVSGMGASAYTNSIRNMTPRQAYRRVRRVLELQWRGIILVLIIIVDVILFTIVFLDLDNTEQSFQIDPAKASDWTNCLMETNGNKNACLSEAKNLVVNLSTVVAVLVLLTWNGLWLLILLGRWEMFLGWKEWASSLRAKKPQKEFVSVDAQKELKKDPRSYEMLSRSSERTDSVLTPVSPARTPPHGMQPATSYFPTTSVGGNNYQTYFQDYRAHANSSPLAHPMHSADSGGGGGWDGVVPQQSTWPADPEKTGGTRG